MRCPRAPKPWRQSWQCASRRRARTPLGAEETADRLGRLARARRQVQAHRARNHHQRELKGTTLALIRYLEEHWRTPGWRADYDSWWPVIQRYAGVLATESFTGRGALKRLKALLNQNQNRPAIDL